MLAAGCSDRCPTAVADRDAGPSIAMASSDPIPTTTNTVAGTITIAVASTGSSTAGSSTAAPSSASAFGQRRTGRQSNDRESEHELSESCHGAPPP